jgi:hypothetical protein
MLSATMARHACTRGSAIAATVLSAALTIVGVPALAGPPEPVPSVGPGAGDAATERARELYGRGRAKYETFDYLGAIELWTDAYDMLPDGEQYSEIRGKLMFNIAAARLEAYDIDDKVSHLRQAQRLMDIYVASLGDADGDEAAEARQWQERIGYRLADAERSAAMRRAQGRARAELAPTKVDVRAAKRARALTIAGASVLAVGVAALGAMGGGLGWGARLEADARHDADARPPPPAGQFDGVLARGRTANGLAIGGAVVAGVAITAGVVMLALGLRRAAKPRSAAAGASRRMAWGAGGVGWRW